MPSFFKILLFSIVYFPPFYTFYDSTLAYERCEKHEICPQPCMAVDGVSQKVKKVCAIGDWEITTIDCASVAVVDCEIIIGIK